MYGKLAWRNIRRSLQDYGIYFLTLVFAVAIFYVFHSVGDQPSFLALKGERSRMARGMVESIQWVTMIMSGVVGLLVLYANRVIIKKRHRELGTYLLLGMEQGRLAWLLLAEVSLIGLAALGVGLVSGVFLSQFFALVVDQVVSVGPQRHSFIFSPGTALKTLLYYGLIFLLVGIWQAAAVYRQRLIDLIIGARKNEEIRLRSRPLSWIAGLLSAVALGTAYWLSDRVSRDGWLQPEDPRIWTGVVLGVVGTYLLFVALAGLLTGVRRRSSGWMARGLNLFLYRQVTSKINTNVGVLATIALMLTLSLCAMSAGLGIGRAARSGMERATPFDYVFYSQNPAERFEPVLRLIDEHGLTPRGAVRFDTAQSDLRSLDLMLPLDRAWFEANPGAAYMAELPVRVLPLSAYQELRALRGYPAVELPAGRFLIHTSGEEMDTIRWLRGAFQRFLDSGESVELAGQVLQAAVDHLLAEPLGQDLLGFRPVLVVPDAVAAALPPQEAFLMLDLGGPIPDALDQALVGLERNVRPGGSNLPDLGVTSRLQAMSIGLLVEGTAVFFSFYMGVMFILISATMLALQQLTDAVEHRQRFEILRKLGADEPMIDWAMARQLGLYFMAPVAVAILHSVMALVALARLLRFGAGYTTVWPATLVTLGIFALVYSAYYLLSLQSCRALFRQRQTW